MKTATLTPTLTQLTRLRFVNAFLVREDDGFTLVDTTMGGDKAAEQLLAAAREAGAPIRRIALTHGHGDHVGGLDALKERLGADVEVLMPELDARIHDGEQVVEGKPPGSWPTLKTKPEVRLQAGDRLGSLEVVASPGHTPGHVAFLDTRDRTLIAGDIYTTYGSGRSPTTSTGASRSPRWRRGTRRRTSSRRGSCTRSTPLCSSSATGLPSARPPRR